MLIPPQQSLKRRSTALCRPLIRTRRPSPTPTIECYQSGPPVSFPELAVPTVDVNETTTLDHVVPTAGTEFLVYGIATEPVIETLCGLVDVLCHWTAVEFYSEADPVQFELRMSDPPILSEIASHAGYLEWPRDSSAEDLARDAPPASAQGPKTRL